MEKKLKELTQRYLSITDYKEAKEKLKAFLDWSNDKYTDKETGDLIETYLQQMADHFHSLKTAQRNTLQSTIGTQVVQDTIEDTKCAENANIHANIEPIIESFNECVNQCQLTEAWRKNYRKIQTLDREDFSKVVEAFKKINWPFVKNQYTNNGTDGE